MANNDEHPGSTYVQPVLPGQTNTIVQSTLAGRFRVVACFDDGLAQRSDLLCLLTCSAVSVRHGYRLSIPNDVGSKGEKRAAG
jgi:hypothetical protein